MCVCVRVAVAGGLRWGVCVWTDESDVGQRDVKRQGRPATSAGDQQRPFLCVQLLQVRRLPRVRVRRAVAVWGAGESAWPQASSRIEANRIKSCVRNEQREGSHKAKPLLRFVSTGTANIRATAHNETSPLLASSYERVWAKRMMGHKDRRRVVSDLWTSRSPRTLALNELRASSFVLICLPTCAPHSIKTHITSCIDPPPPQQRRSLSLLSVVFLL